MHVKEIESSLALALSCGSVSVVLFMALTAVPPNLNRTRPLGHVIASERGERRTRQAKILKLGKGVDPHAPGR